MESEVLIAVRHQQPDGIWMSARDGCIRRPTPQRAWWHQASKRGDGGRPDVRFSESAIRSGRERLRWTDVGGFDVPEPDASFGTDNDTASFAVATARRWFAMGRSAPAAEN